MVGVDARLSEIAQLALSISCIDFGIAQLGGLRTAEEQHALYKAHASKCDGYEIKSKHQSGQALDVYAYLDGRATWDPVALAMVACAMLEASNRLKSSLIWGGHFRPLTEDPFLHGWDMGHFELLYKQE